MSWAPMGDGGHQERGDTLGRDSWGEADWRSGPSAEAAEPTLGVHWCPEPSSVQLLRHFLVFSPHLGTP